MTFFKKIFGGIYDDLWKAIIRPDRDIYEQKELGLDKFTIKGRYYKRTDFSIINNRNMKLQCSFWEPFDEERDMEKMPCVIYLHGNSSSRCEAVSEAKSLLHLNICFFAFDFGGCGQSEGDYISLGWYEKEDVLCVTEYLRKTNKVSSICLWGRSMGAVTALMYFDCDPFISGLIIDSPFSSLNVLIKELVNKHITLPDFIFNKVMLYVKDTILEKAKFKLDEIEPIKSAKRCNIPALFCFSKNDDFIPSHHCKELFEAYEGDKELIEINGDHNSIRPKHFKHSAFKFLYKTFQAVSISKKMTIQPKTVVNTRNEKHANTEDLTQISNNISNILKPLLSVRINMTNSKLPKPPLFDSDIVLLEDEYYENFLNNTLIK